MDVVMSTNRVSPFLDETLASLLAQTYKRSTLTVVADGCPNPASLTAAIERVPGCRCCNSPIAAFQLHAIQVSDTLEPRFRPARRRRHLGPEQA